MTSEQRRGVHRWQGVILAGVMAMAMAGSPAFAADNQSKAVALFQTADGKFADGRYVEARKLYAQAHALYPDPSILYMVGRCHELEREFVDAQKIFRKVLEMEDVPVKVQLKSKEGLEYLDRLYPTAHPLRMTTNRPGEWSVDGASAGTGASLDVKVSPGSHVLRLRDEEGRNVEAVVEVAGDTRVAFQIEGDGVSSATGPWLLSGAGAAFVGSGLYLAVTSLGLADDAEGLAADGLSGASTRKKDNADLLWGLGWSMTALGSAALGTGIYLLFSEATSAPRAEAGLGLTPNGVVVRW